MLTPSSSVEDLYRWLKNKSYLYDGTILAEGPYQLSIQITESLTPKQLKELLLAVENPTTGSIVYKYGYRSFVASSTIADTQLALKYYHRLNLRRQLGYTLRNSRCMIAWIASRALYELGIPTPKPIAVFEKKRFGLITDKALLVTEIAEGIPLPQFLNNHGNDLKLMDTVAQNCRKIFHKFKEYRIYHGDTAPKNFIISPTGEVSIIDLDAVCVAMPEPLFTKKHKKDIHQFSTVWINFSSHLEPIFTKYF